MSFSVLNNVVTAYIDVKYINLISGRLRNFKRKDEKLFNFSCPLCGDSETVKTKARGYIYQKGTKYWFHCHNCSVSYSFGNFLKQFDGVIHQEYSLERYRNSDKYIAPKQVIVEPELVNKIELESIADLPNDHCAKSYLLKRKIPADKLRLLYFAPDFARFVQTLRTDGKYNHLTPDEARIVIPFYNRRGEVIAVQGRALNAEKKLRYVTCRLNDNEELIYGLERVNNNERVLIAEGPFDSLFLSNGIAAAGSCLSRARNLFSKENCVLVFDNEPRNKEILRLIEEQIDDGYNVCIWPKNINEKDINDMVLAGKTPTEVNELIVANTYTGLKAKLEFNYWKNR